MTWSAPGPKERHKITRKQKICTHHMWHTWKHYFEIFTIILWQSSGCTQYTYVLFTPLSHDNETSAFSVDYPWCSKEVAEPSYPTLIKEMNALKKPRKRGTGGSGKVSKAAVCENKEMSLLMLITRHHSASHKGESMNRWKWNADNMRNAI